MWESVLPQRGCQMPLGARDCEAGRQGGNAHTWLTQSTRDARQAEPHVCTLPRLSPPQGGTQKPSAKSWGQARQWPLGCCESSCGSSHSTYH